MMMTVSDTNVSLSHDVIDTKQKQNEETVKISTGLVKSLASNLTISAGT